MKNYVQKGDAISLVAPYDRTSGQGALVGSIFGVATSDVLSGATGTFALTGVFDITKATGAVTQGALIYWDNTNKVATTSSGAGANKLIGVATQAQASGDATARVRLNEAYIS